MSASGAESGTLSRRSMEASQMNVNAWSRMVTVAVLAVVVPANVFAAGIPTVNWFQITTANSPSARSYPAMAYDAVSRKVVLFGGYNGVYLNDTWTFDGTNWTKIATPISPPVRTAAS